MSSGQSRVFVVDEVEAHGYKLQKALWMRPGQNPESGFRFLRADGMFHRGQQCLPSIDLILELLELGRQKWGANG